MPNQTQTLVTDKAPGSAIGFNLRTQSLVNTVKTVEWEIFRRALTGKLAGTKFSCTQKTDERILYQFKNQPITLSHTFIFIHNTVYAIHHNKSLLIPERHAAQYHIQPIEWEFAKHQLDKKPDHAKLKHCKKYWVDEHVRHHAIILDGVIYAYAGPGWRIKGGYAKIKIAINEHGEYFALKIPFKISFLGPAMSATLSESTREEIQIASLMQLLVAHHAKQNAIPPNLPVMLLRFYETDLFEFVKYAVKKTGELKSKHADSEVDLFFHITENRLLHMLLQTICDLEKLHDKNIIHRDIKPENILVNFDQCIQAKLGDFGFATQTQNGIVFGEIMGTPSYFAPELQDCLQGQSLSLSPMQKTVLANPAIHSYDQNQLIALGKNHKIPTYTFASDVFAIGKTASCLLHVLYHNTIQQNLFSKNAVFQALINTSLLEQTDPQLRIHLTVFKLIWIAILENDFDVCENWSQYAHPLKTKACRTLLQSIFIAFHKITPHEFADMRWVSLLLKFEKKLENSDKKIKSDATMMRDIVLNILQYCISNPDRLHAETNSIQRAHDLVTQILNADDISIQDLRWLFKIYTTKTDYDLMAHYVLSGRFFSLPIEMQNAIKNYINSVSAYTDADIAQTVTRHFTLPSPCFFARSPQDEAAYLQKTKNQMNAAKSILEQLDPSLFAPLAAAQAASSTNMGVNS